MFPCFLSFFDHFWVPITCHQPTSPVRDAAIIHVVQDFEDLRPQHGVLETVIPCYTIIESYTMIIRVPSTFKTIINMCVMCVSLCTKKTWVKKGSGRFPERGTQMIFTDYQPRRRREEGSQHFPHSFKII